ncbi:hypothetical protein CR513_35274, partial [Mucuna pruriens]
MAEMSSVTQKRYTRSVLAIQERPTQKQDPQIKFSDKDCEGTILQLDNPMVISVVIADYKMERLDQRPVLAGFPKDGFFESIFGGMSRNANQIRKGTS